MCCRRAATKLKLTNNQTKIWAWFRQEGRQPDTFCRFLAPDNWYKSPNAAVFFFGFSTAVAEIEAVGLVLHSSASLPSIRCQWLSWQFPIPFLMMRLILLAYEKMLQCQNPRAMAMPYFLKAGDGLIVLLMALGRCSSRLDWGVCIAMRDFQDSRW